MTELTERIERLAIQDGTIITAYHALSFVRSSDVSEPVPAVYKPSLCVIAQGAKQVLLGPESYFYDPGSYLVASVHLPITGQVIDASPEKPYLSLQLQFEMDQILDIIQQPYFTENTGHKSHRALVIGQMSNSLHEAILRLIRLLDTPEDLPALAPYAVREILYRMLQTEQGNTIRNFALLGSRAQRIVPVIEQINREYTEPMRVDNLAKAAGMSTSSFFSCFKEVTAMTPLQYQKRLRLTEARRLLLATMSDATSVAYQVGYESATQFNREYARLFGQPPIRDVRRFLGMNPQ
ncbi:AraC family transcriptional regulator [Paenibacillus sp. FSL R7-0297]|uniref:AraC family transcriptional regulator n=1 Tax=Paenibacillus sp. FSL R7-0297 TaxID=2921680 RepID=UPI0030F75193